MNESCILFQIFLLPCSSLSPTPAQSYPPQCQNWHCIKIGRRREEEEKKTHRCQPVPVPLALCPGSIFRRFCLPALPFGLAEVARRSCGWWSGCTRRYTTRCTCSFPFHFPFFNFCLNSGGSVRDFQERTGLSICSQILETCLERIALPCSFTPVGQGRGCQQVWADDRLLLLALLVCKYCDIDI